jgi:hypothetical protein
VRGWGITEEVKPAGVLIPQLWADVQGIIVCEVVVQC